jgi:hypothetical protein
LVNYDSSSGDEGLVRVQFSFFIDLPLFLIQVDEAPDEGEGGSSSQLVGYDSSSGDEGAESCPICLLRLR